MPATWTLRDPNLLFKGFWPATALWRRCVQYAAKVSPEFAEEILGQISDADIAGFERVIYGATLAGGPALRRGDHGVAPGRKPPRHHVLAIRQQRQVLMERHRDSAL